MSSVSNINSIYRGVPRVVIVKIRESPWLDYTYTVFCAWPCVCWSTSQAFSSSPKGSGWTRPKPAGLAPVIYRGPYDDPVRGDADLSIMIDEGGCFSGWPQRRFFHHLLGCLPSYCEVVKIECAARCIRRSGFPSRTYMILQGCPSIVQAFSQVSELTQLRFLEHKFSTTSDKILPVPT